ncbi:MAG TPA: prolyl oligopeptidase family serine peptidase [Pseudonocardiaceae bacterium]|nr:prolyl oligopeptidase family serine peptidase [Pseudonocardiaceae bacterium]
MTAASDDRILLYSPISRRLVIRSNATGASRLGWAPLGDPGAHFPDTLCRPGYPRHALTWDESGERLLVHEADGARSRLFRYTPADDELAAVHTLPGAVSTPALWIGNRVHVPFSNPAHPRTLATIHGGTSGKPVGHTVRQRARWSEPAVSTVSTAPAASPVPTAPTMRSANRPGARLVRLAGADGPIEAIVYGGRDWLRRDQLVVALHGGPLSAWRCEFDPLLSSLAAAGMAVLAPNYRGSTGYGEQHLRAPIGCWGGPDLDDVSALGGSLHRDRADAGLPGPLVLGVSYGAYLALLAACAEATTWSGCVALAPFLSGPSLHASAGEAVRDRVAALGGLGRAEDPSTAPDVLRQCASLTAPLLLVHGSRDERVPVVQSRVLRRRLLELGRVEGVDFGYLEPDADHAGVIAEWPAPLLRRIVRFCRTRRVAPPAAGGSAEAPDGERR